MGIKRQSNKPFLTRVRTGMTELEALELLQRHNRWRRGEEYDKIFIKRSIDDNRTKHEVSDYRFDLDY